MQGFIKEIGFSVNKRILKKDIYLIKKRICEIKYRLEFLSTTNTFENNERRALLGELYYIKQQLKDSLGYKQTLAFRLV